MCVKVRHAHKHSFPFRFPAYAPRVVLAGGGARWEARKPAICRLRVRARTEQPHPYGGRVVRSARTTAVPLPPCRRGCVFHFWMA